MKDNLSIHVRRSSTGWACQITQHGRLLMRADGFRSMGAADDWAGDWVAQHCPRVCGGTRGNPASPPEPEDEWTSMFYHGVRFALGDGYTLDEAFDSSLNNIRDMQHAAKFDQGLWFPPSMEDVARRLKIRPTRKTRPRRNPGPTDLNLETMERELARAGGAIREVHRGRVAGLRKCIAAGFLAQRPDGAWVATPAGEQALADLRERKELIQRRWRGNPAILERCVRKVGARGLPQRRSWAICTAGLQRAGILEPGHRTLTAKGRTSELAAEARDRAESEPPGWMLDRARKNRSRRVLVGRSGRVVYYAVTLGPGEGIGPERHPGKHQVSWVVSGSATLVGKGLRRTGRRLVVPLGRKHDVVAGPRGARLLNAYVGGER